MTEPRTLYVLDPHGLLTPEDMHRVLMDEWVRPATVDDIDIEAAGLALRMGMPIEVILRAALGETEL